MEENKYVDAESYQGGSYGKDELSFRIIILQHLKRISQLAAVEFRGGYWEIKETPISMGSAAYTIKNRVYIPDSREVYSNAVECFADMLAPYFDEQMQKAEEKARKDIEKAYLDKTSVVEQEKEGDEEVEIQPKREFRSTNEKISFRSQKRQINRDLFRALCSFLYRKKYLELGVIED